MDMPAIAMASFCAPLRSRSSYSLLRGTAPLERLIAAVRTAGHDTMALTDRNNLYAAVRFAGLARAAGLTPILGVELDEPAESAGAAGSENRVAIVLARAATGYRTLTRLITRRHLDPTFKLAPALAGEHEDVWILAADPDLLAALRGGLPPDRLAVLVELGGGGERAAMARGRSLARRLGLAAVAAPAVTYASAHEVEIARLLAAARRGAVVAAVTDAELPAPGCRPEPPHAIARRYGAEASDLLARGREIAADCRAELPPGTPIFPRPALAGGETAYTALLERCLDGIRKRYGALVPRPVNRLMRELDVIARLGYTEYFLIVGDIVDFARSEGLAVVGRGSGASSIVAYVLGITNVDPLAHRLHFERFLSAARGADLPDLDIDLDWRGRDRVIEHVYRTHGEGRVAMISTHTFFHPRSAFREAARAHGVPVDVVNGLARFLPHDGSDLPSLARSLPGLRDLPWTEEPWRSILDGAAGLNGLPRHLGIHPGGIVIGDRPLADLVPLESATKGIVVTQYEMEAVAAIGLVKIDLLGNRALATLGEAVALVGSTEGAAIDLDRAHDRDQSTAELLAAGDSLGCFQIESPGMRHLLVMLAPRSVREVVDALSLIRPGPASSGMKERFVRRARGLEPVATAHPALASVLAATYGIPLYEEDVMSIAAAVAEIDLEAGDSLRRAIAGAASTEEMQFVKNGFVARAVRAGVEPDRALAVWEEMARFAAYSFSRAHAAGYGLLAYQSAFLKAHHPAPFACAVLNHHQGMYARWVHVEDARRHGVGVLLPSVDRSAAEFTLEVGEEGEAPAVRTGLGAVAGMSTATLEAILAARSADGPFSSLSDFRRRVRASAPEIEALIQVGAFDHLGCERSRLLWEARALTIRATDPVEPGLFSGSAGEAPPPPLRELSLGRCLRAEWAGLGFSPRAHPLFAEAPELASALDPAAARTLGIAVARLPGAPRGPRWMGAGQIGTHIGQRAAVIGLVAARRRTSTRHGETMSFLTLDDPTGTAECTLFPAVHRRAAHAMAGGGPLRVEGVVSEQHGAASLEVDRLESLASRGRESPKLAPTGSGS